MLNIIKNKPKMSKHLPKNGPKAKNLNWIGVYAMPNELSIQIRKSNQK